MRALYSVAPPRSGTFGAGQQLELLEDEEAAAAAAEEDEDEPLPEDEDEDAAAAAAEDEDEDEDGHCFLLSFGSASLFVLLTFFMLPNFFVLPFRLLPSESDCCLLLPSETVTPPSEPLLLTAEQPFR